MDFSTFTRKQKEDYQAIHDLQHKLEELFRDGCFILKPEAAEIMEKIDDIASYCNHYYENGQCIICGRLKEN